jgi:hypothetical protein
MLEDLDVHYIVRHMWFARLLWILIDYLSFNADRALYHVDITLMMKTSFQSNISYNGEAVFLDIEWFDWLLVSRWLARNMQILHRNAGN